VITTIKFEPRVTSRLDWWIKLSQPPGSTLSGLILWRASNDHRGLSANRYKGDTFGAVPKEFAVRF